VFNKEKILFYNSLANEITLNTVKSVQTLEGVYKADGMLITFGVLSLSDQTFLSTPFYYLPYSSPICTVDDILFRFTLYVRVPLI